MDLTGLEADINRIVSRRGAMLVRATSAGGDYRHGGIMNSTEVVVEPLETDEDENGETRQVGVKFELETRLMQTEATTSFSLMQELTSGKVDLILSSTAVSSDVLTSTNAEAAGELKFAGRHLKIGGELQYSRKESYLPARIGFRAPMSTINEFAL